MARTLTIGVKKRYGKAIEELKKEKDGDYKIIVELEKCKRKHLTQEERKELRAFYWAAFFGIKKFVKLMIAERKWSPFMKSF